MNTADSNSESPNSSSEILSKEMRSLDSLDGLAWSRIAARLSTGDFARYASKGKWVFAPHLELLNKKLVELCDPDTPLRGLCLNVPPRHGKSELCSRYLPAWFLGTNKNGRVLLACHEGRFAASWGRKARDLIDEHGSELWGVRVRKDSHAADSWNLDGCEGGFQSAGLSGSLTGKGASLFIADDLIKSSEQASSKHQLQKAHEMVMTCIETRLEPGASCVMIQTRWSEDDPSGKIIKEIENGLRPDWETIIFPAIAEDNDILGRSPGDPLWPERYDIKYLESLKNRWDHDEARMGAYWWEALYQQNPSPREGGLFKRPWFKYCHEDGEFYQMDGGGCWMASDCWKIITVDLAVSQKEGSDYFALGVWGVTPNRDLMLLDLIHDRIAGPDQADIIEQTFHEHQPMLVSVEATQYQLSLVQELVRRGLPARAVTVRGDKVARAQLAATRFSAGTVYLRRHAPWLTEFEDELLVFPNGRHDDMVDITSMAANELSTMVVPEVY